MLTVHHLGISHCDRFVVRLREKLGMSDELV